MRACTEYSSRLYVYLLPDRQSLYGLPQARVLLLTSAACTTTKASPHVAWNTFVDLVICMKITYFVVSDHTDNV